MDTFTPPIPPQEGPSGEFKFNVIDIAFGEGYVSSFAEGMNNRLQTWPMTWKGTDAEVLPIRDFFDAHNGYQRFLWTPPHGVQGQYVVKNYTLVPSAAGNCQITATLIQRFGP